MERVGTRALIASAAALVAGAAYIDGHLGISKDINQLLADRRFIKRVEKRIGSVGNVAGLYGHLKIADPDAEGLWFEGGSWTYAQILRGKITGVCLQAITDESVL